MRAFALPIVCSVLGALLVAAASRPLEELRGFSARAARDERDWEAKLQAIPSTDSMRSYMRRLSARPHHVGSPYDKANAEWLLAQFKKWGWQAQIETRSEEHTSELQSRLHLVCRLLLEKKNTN